MTKQYESQPQRPSRPIQESPITRRELALSSAEGSLSHHERNCTICRHPDRDAIEEAFLQWRSVSNIRLEFKLPSRTTLYRHAHALGLFARRGRNLRFALEHIIENAEAVTPTAEAVIRAVHAYTRLNDAGEWIEPPAHVIVSSGSAAYTSLRPDAAHPLPPRVDLAAVEGPDAPHRALHESPITSHQSLLQPGTPVRAENDATR